MGDPCMMCSQPTGASGVFETRHTWRMQLAHLQGAKLCHAGGIFAIS